MKYDDASWHSGGNFPKDLPAIAGATHIGMYLAWALFAGLGSSLHADKSDDIKRLSGRAITPGAFFLWACDGKLTDDDFNDEGNAFTERYFDTPEQPYLSDYEAVFGDDLPGGAESLYYVEDSWENFEKLRPVLDRRLADWRALG